MTREDEEWVRELEAVVPRRPVTAEAWFWTTIGDLLKLVRVMDAMGSDLKEDSKAYQSGWTEARRELLEVFGRRNHLFQLPPDTPIQAVRDLVNVHLRPYRGMMGRLPGIADARLQAMFRQQQLFGDATLPEICMMLRQGVNGSAEEWRPAAIQTALDMLRERIRTWHFLDQDDARRETDTAVYNLVRATIAEVVQYDWWQADARGND